VDGIDTRKVYEQMHAVMTEVGQHAARFDQPLLVLGFNSSAVLGEHLGTATNEAIAVAAFGAVQEAAEIYNLAIAYQACEHLNRALVVSRDVQRMLDLEEVTVVPVPHAGGAMASIAFRELSDAVVVENIARRANLGVDVGGTLIGMHLRHVAKPIPLTQTKIGAATVTAAYSRPKLIGGQRAVYQR
jgi:uncharacterized protein (TIGR01440 family)